MTVNSQFNESSALELLQATVNSHQEICESLGIFHKYPAAVRSRKNIGGNSPEACQLHLLGRFLNSAARVQAAVCHRDTELDNINEQIVAQMYAGELHLIDIAAGNGAGTISMLNGIWHKRIVEETLPTDRLKVSIHAIDFAPNSLGFYAQQLKQLEGKYAQAGITVAFYPWQTDLTKDADVQKTIESIRATVQGERRFLLICSAISGVSKSTFEQHFGGSFGYIAKAFKERNSTFLWIEPFTRNNWLKSAWDTLVAYIHPKSNKPNTSAVSANEVKLRFRWIDPHTECTLRGEADFYLVGLADE